MSYCFDNDKICFNCKHSADIHCINIWGALYAAETKGIIIEDPMDFVMNLPTNSEISSDYKNELDFYRVSCEFISPVKYKLYISNLEEWKKYVLSLDPGYSLAQAFDFPFEFDAYPVLSRDN